MKTKNCNLPDSPTTTRAGRRLRSALIGLTTALALLGANAGHAAETQIPAAAAAMHARLAAALKPAVREWVFREAKKISQDSAPGEAALKADIQARFAGQPLAGADVEALAFMVLMEATQSAQNDLKTVMAEVKSVNKQKDALRQTAKNLPKEAAVTNLPVRSGVVMLKPDAAGEMSETDSLRLQMAMDRRSKLMETLSNVMKKISDTQGNIVGNLK